MLPASSVTPLPLAFALNCVSTLFVWRREGEEALKFADALLTLSMEQGFSNWQSFARIDRGHSLALMGKVFCKVDASYGPIEVGDLLTTSDTPGHAMKAFDHRKAFGAVIGKALGPITSGQGLVPVLVALR